jgi:hypothetical protein
MNEIVSDATPLIYLAKIMHIIVKSDTEYYFSGHQ